MTKNIHPENEQNTETMTKSKAAEKNGNKKGKRAGKDEKIKELEARLAELNEKYLRLYSDFENFRKRTAREKIELIDSASRNVILDILPVIDDFERAIESNKNIEDPETLREGFLHIYNKLQSILEKEGVKPMRTIGEPFDMEFQEAVARIPAPEEKLKGKVIDETEKGYFLNDKVLRYAKVVVGD